MSRPARLPEGFLLLGIAAAVTPSRRALSAVGAHGAELLAEGLFSHQPSGTRFRGVAVEEADRMLSELAVRGNLEVSLEHRRLHYVLWVRDAPP